MGRPQPLDRHLKWILEQLHMQLSGADPGIYDRGAHFSSRSLKQGLWGMQSPRSWLQGT